MIPIGISTITADPAGAWVLYPDVNQTNLGEWTRRVQRTATLNGGVIIIDNGFTHSDRTIRLDVSDENEDTQTNLKRIVQLYSTVLLFLPDGAYKAVPEKFYASGSSAIMTLMISGTAEVKQ